MMAGRATAAQSAEAGVLRHFIGMLMEPIAPRPWDRLFSGEAHLTARATYFLLHREKTSGMDSEDFITRVLERILHQFTCSTRREQVALQGRVKGKVLWPATLKSRYTDDYDPTRFVCREVHRHFDTPENQLLRYMVETIGHWIQAVPDVMRQGFCYSPGSGFHSPTTIAARLDKMEDYLIRLRRDRRLREVTVPATINEEHLLRSEVAKMEEYSLVAALYRQYKNTVISPSWNGVVQFGHTVLPLPGKPDADGYPWLRLAAAVVRSNGQQSPLRS